MNDSDLNISPADHDVEQIILQLLTRGPKMTTKEVVSCVEGYGLSCPDEPVRFLNKLRMKGKIKGQLSIEHKGWLWWI